MVDISRLWRRGRRRGTAEGVGVFGSPGFADNPHEIAALLGRHERLSGWMRTAGLDLEVSAAGLQTVDAMIDLWRDDPVVAPGLANEVGIFLGDVMLHEISDAGWHVLPNGHPVIRLGNGQELDVIVQTASRVRKGKPQLNLILQRAAAAGARPTNRMG